MKHSRLLIYITIFIVFSITLVGCNKNHVKETNLKVERIMNDKIPEIKDFFHRNSENFLAGIKSDIEYPSNIIVSGENVRVDKEDIVIVSSYFIKDCFIFSVFGGAVDGCNYSVSIVYFNDELYDKNMIDKGLIKLQDNWYIYKDIKWNT